MSKENTWRLDGSLPTGSELDGTERTMYVVEAPVRKDGTIVVGNFGVRTVCFVVFEMGEWKKLCEDVPQLKVTKFRVGSL